MGIMTGKRGIIFGIANERSYAFYVAKQLKEQGAELAFTYLPMGKMEHRVRKAAASLGVDDPWLVECDANSDESLDAVFAKYGDDFATLDFFVHSIAFANKDYLQPGKFVSTPRDVYLGALDTSAYTYLAMAQRAAPLMARTGDGKDAPGGAAVCLSYYGGEKVTPGYNVMGVAKAALEHTTRYLAFELGTQNVRVNCISAGPFKTLAGSGVGGIDDMIKYQEFASSMKRCNTGEEVGDTAVYLLSGMASGVTGETVHVDAGFSIVGVPEKPAETTA
ncbi:MAG: enoyl-ACP reductase [Planctomycetota bacterium]